ncbi:RHS repeat-associated core domain-containing protein [Subtercola boreus]
MTADPNGTYAYNGAEQMTSAVIGGNTITYTYGGTGQNEVLSETGPKGTYNLAYGRSDAQGQPIIEQYNVNGGTAYVESDPKTGQPLMLHTSNDIAALYVYDGTGSPIGLLTDYSSTALANTYDPYGTPTLTAGGTGSGINQNPYVFKGGVQSRETGWVHYGARWYNPATGRFTQQDTLDAPLNPANANRYAYAADDPVNLSDPLGTDADQDYVNGCLGGVIVGEGYAALGDVETLGVSAVAGAIIGCAAGFESAYLQENDEDQLDTDLTDLNYYTTICGLVC